MKATNPRLTQADLAARFNTTQATISRVLSGKTHGQPPVRALTDEQVQEIRYAAATGRATQAELAERYGIAQPGICAIVQGGAYRDVPLSDAELARLLRLEVLDAEFRFVSEDTPVVPSCPAPTTSRPLPGADVSA